MSRNGQPDGWRPGWAPGVPGAHDLGCLVGRRWVVCDGNYHMNRGILWFIVVYCIVYLGLLGFIGAYYGWYYGLLWFIGAYYTSMDENWGTPILGNLHFKGGLIHQGTKRSQAEHLGASFGRRHHQLQTAKLPSYNMVMGNNMVVLPILLVICTIMCHIVLLRNY